MEAYKEMQNNLDYLGIDIEGINNAVNATENIIGCDTVDYDIDVFNENVRANIDEIINAVSANESVLDKLTDIIISSYYNEAAYVLEEYAKSSGLEDVSFQAENKKEYGKYQISAVVDGEIKPITSGDELDELFEYLETERDAETKKATDIEQEITADSIIDIENDIQINDDYNKLDVYVVMDDQTLDTLMKRADMYEKSGYKDFDEIIGSSAIVNSYFVADEKGVDIVLTLDDGERYHDATFSEHPDENEFPLSHDESGMIKEKLEHFLGRPVVEYLKAVKWEEIERANKMENNFLDIMRYMGVDLERINEAFHRAENIVTEGIGNEEDKRYQCEVLHGNVRDRISETLQESAYSISKDSIADGLITQAFVDSYLNEAQTMVAEREQPKNEPPKPKKEKPSIELD